MRTIMPPPGLVYSDARQKRDLQQLDVLPNGVKLYRYRYRWSATEYVGVLAHEVAALVPEAVSKDDDGFFRVNYRHLGLQLRTYEDWVNKGHLTTTTLPAPTETTAHQKPVRIGAAG